MNAQSLYRTVKTESGLMDGDAARRATAAVMHALRDRLTPEEARQAAAQLPRDVKSVWFYGEARGRRPIKMHRKDFYERVRGEAFASECHLCMTLMRVEDPAVWSECAGAVVAG